MAERPVSPDMEEAILNVLKNSGKTNMFRVTIQTTDAAQVPGNVIKFKALLSYDDRRKFIQQLDDLMSGPVFGYSITPLMEEGWFDYGMCNMLAEMVRKQADDWNKSK
jgi:hypothetical protein